MSAFDYLHDATPPLVARLLQMRLGKAYHTLATVLTFAGVLVLGASVLERLRLDQANALRTVELTRLRTAQAALTQAKFQTRDVNALIGLDAKLQDVRTSGLRRAAFIVKLGEQIPAGAWLESIVSNGSRDTLTGRALNVTDVAGAIGRLDRAGFHHVTLDALSRVAVGGATPEFEFTVGIDSDE